MKRFYVDTSVIITLIGVGQAVQLGSLPGEVFVPDAVLSELLVDKDLSRIGELSEKNILELGSREDVHDEQEGDQVFRRAAEHLGRDVVSESEISGDVALLSLGLADDSGVVVTDDKPLRKACKALGIPISGSIGVVIAAVEQGELDPDEAKDTVVAMDEVGARLSASLLRKAERLIDEATGPE